MWRLTERLWSNWWRCWRRRSSKSMPSSYFSMGRYWEQTSMLIVIPLAESKVHPWAEKHDQALWKYLWSWLLAQRHFCSEQVWSRSLVWNCWANFGAACYWSALPRWHFGQAHVDLRTETEEEWIDDMNKEFSQLSHKVWQELLKSKSRGFLAKCGGAYLMKSH